MIICTTQSAARQAARDLHRRPRDTVRAGVLRIAVRSCGTALFAVLLLMPAYCVAQYDSASPTFRDGSSGSTSATAATLPDKDTVWRPHSHAGEGAPLDSADDRRRFESLPAAPPDQHESRYGTQPTPIPAARSGSSTAIPLARRDAFAADDRAREHAADAGPGIGQVIVALCVVLLLILGMARILSGKSLRLPGGLPRDVVDVLGRRTVDGKNSLVLIRLGGKLLLLSSSPGGLSPVSEVTDPIEVASLTTLTKAAQDTSAGSIRNVFDLFSKHRRPDSTPSETFAARLSAAPPTTPSPLPVNPVEFRRFTHQGERA